MGTDESVKMVKNSAAIRRHIKRGKLDLTYLPKNVSVAGQEEISSFFTNHWVMQRVLQPAEWLLVYQTDSMHFYTIILFRTNCCRHYVRQKPRYN